MTSETILGEKTGYGLSKESSFEQLLFFEKLGKSCGSMSEHVMSSWRMSFYKVCRKVFHVSRFRVWWLHMSYRECQLSKDGSHNVLVEVRFQWELPRRLHLFNLAPINSKNVQKNHKGKKTLYIKTRLVVSKLTVVLGEFIKVVFTFIQLSMLLGCSLHFSLECLSTFVFTLQRDEVTSEGHTERGRPGYTAKTRV